MEIDTPHGPARAHLHPADGTPRAALLLGHGAGGSVAAPDLLAATGVAVAAGVSVALVEQPYRVAGKKATPRPPVLDAGWLAVVAALRADAFAGLPLVFGGRSSGARVACRCARDGGAVAVLALAFPLQPPPRRDGSAPPSRQDELDAAGVPTLVVQGVNDRFGMPAADAARGREVVALRGDHGLKSDAAGLRAAVGGWLARVV